MRRAKLVFGAAASILAAFFVAGAITAQRQEGRNKEDVSLKVAWQKEFPEEIVDFGIGTTPSGESYPQVVATRSKLIFFGKPGETATERVLPHIINTEGGANEVSEAYVADNGYVVEYWRKTDDQQKEFAFETLFVYESGRLLWRTGSVVPEAPRLSPDGRFVVGPECAECSGVLWAGEGRGSKHINPYDFLGEERTLVRSFYGFSGDSKYWGVSCGVGTVVMRVYDSEGNSVLSKVLESGGAALAGPIAVSRDLQYIAVIYPEGGGRFVPLYLHMFDREGNLLWKREIYWAGNYQIDFSPIGDYVLVSSVLGRTYAVEPVAGNPIWDFIFPIQVRPLSSDSGHWYDFPSVVDISKDGRYVAVSCRSDSTEESYVFLFDARSGYLGQASLGISKSRPRRVRFSPDDQAVYVNADSILYRVNLVEEKRGEGR
jgi:DNA-binding beta-propeller fold protein YncE